MNKISPNSQCSFIGKCHAGMVMDQVTFKSDTVLSEVHLLLPNASHLMKRLNGVGQLGKVRTPCYSIICAPFHTNNDTQVLFPLNIYTICIFGTFRLYN